MIEPLFRTRALIPESMTFGFTPKALFTCCPSYPVSLPERKEATGTSHSSRVFITERNLRDYFSKPLFFVQAERREVKGPLGKPVCKARSLAAWLCVSGSGLTRPVRSLWLLSTFHQQAFCTESCFEYTQSHCWW